MIRRSPISPRPSGSVPERAERITCADHGAIGNRVWQHARAEALALAEVGRQVEVGHGLAVAARRGVYRPARNDIAGVKIAARTYIQDEALTVAPQRARLRFGRKGSDEGE